MKTIWQFRKTLHNLDWKQIQFSKQTMLPQSVSMLAILYLVWVLVNWPQLPGIHSPVDANAGLQSVNLDQSMASPDYLQMAEWQLMGEESMDIQVGQPADALTETPLQLKLLGTFFLSQQPQNSYAIIQSATGEQKKYRLGEPLQEGASLHAVEKSRVVLKHHQQLEYLAFNPNNLAVLTPQN